MTDEELVLAVRAGRREAFDVLTERYWQRCWRIARMYALNREEAEDQTQNALLEAYLHLEQCDATRFRSWLDRIVQNECLQFHRWRGCRPDQFLHLGNMLPRVKSLEENPEQRLRRLELCAMVRHEVSLLPKHWRRVLELRRLEELHIRDVAAGLKIGVRAAKSRLFWAQLGLHARLKRSGLKWC